MINPEDAMNALMIKWLIKVLEPGNSNLHVLMRHRLSMYQPYASGRWNPSLEFFTLPKNQSRRGSMVWNRVTTAWKRLKSETSYVEPCNLEELLSCSLWFCPNAPIIGPGFSKQRAMVLHQRGMRQYRDIWRHTRFINVVEAQTQFGLLPHEAGAWLALTQALCTKWHDLLRTQSPKVKSGEWIGIFNEVEALVPMIVCQATERFQPCLGF